MLDRYTRHKLRYDPFVHVAQKTGLSDAALREACAYAQATPELSLSKAVSRYLDLPPSQREVVGTYAGNLMAGVKTVYLELHTHVWWRGSGRFGDDDSCMLSRHDSPFREWPNNGGLFACWWDEHERPLGRSLVMPHEDHILVLNTYSREGGYFHEGDLKGQYISFTNEIAANTIAQSYGLQARRYRDCTLDCSVYVNSNVMWVIAPEEVQERFHDQYSFELENPYRKITSYPRVVHGVYVDDVFVDDVAQDDGGFFGEEEELTRDLFINPEPPTSVWFQGTILDTLVVPNRHDPDVILIGGENLVHVANPPVRLSYNLRTQQALHTQIEWVGFYKPYTHERQYVGGFIPDPEALQRYVRELTAQGFVPYTTHTLHIWRHLYGDQLPLLLPVGLGMYLCAAATCHHEGDTYLLPWLGAPLSYSIYGDNGETLVTYTTHGDRFYKQENIRE